MRDPDFTGYTPNRVEGVTAQEVIQVTSRHVPCDGGGLGGHPLIWLRVEGDEITCPYCSRTYHLAPGAGDDDHH
ncbi:zinc-finger domain-containing protein [Roseomonas sp. GCM10028921]|uniref:Putative Zn-finger protein n=1 Tax=Muricoccus pecuniae TaxID=693023 RepID=A0A840YCV3_9PROT|nr:zinc-finger domain-containing protein [Roseomonas pecuniae]MBB5694187.1 putative Zn-finger protein [Roseomonas pecuniae]